MATLKRHCSEEELVISVAELLGEGQAKSGANGVPFTYTNAYEIASLGEVTYYLHDHLGNTRVTYTSGCKTEGEPSVPIRELTLVHAADYHPYGSVLREYVNGAQEKYLTTHHERDIETGLDYRGARYYDSDVARFLSLDPLAADYASWSAYNYVMGNPVSLVDPNGKAPWHYEIDNGGKTRLVADKGDNARSYARQFGTSISEATQTLHGLGLIPDLGKDNARLAPYYPITEGKSAGVDAHLRLNLPTSSPDEIVNQVAFAFMNERASGGDRFAYSDYFSGIPKYHTAITAEGAWSYGGVQTDLRVEIPMQQGTAWTESFIDPYRTEQCWASGAGARYCAQEMKSSFNQQAPSGNSLPSINIRYSHDQSTRVNQLLFGQ